MNADSEDERPAVARHDLDGLEVVRVPLAEPDFASGRTVATVQFHATSSRDTDAKLTLIFSGDNIKVFKGEEEEERGARKEGRQGSGEGAGRGKGEWAGAWSVRLCAFGSDAGSWLGAMQRAYPFQDLIGLWCACTVLTARRAGLHDARVGDDSVGHRAAAQARRALLGRAGKDRRAGQLQGHHAGRPGRPGGGACLGAGRYCRTSALRTFNHAALSCAEICARASAGCAVQVSSSLHGSRTRMRGATFTLTPRTNEKSRRASRSKSRCVREAREHTSAARGPWSLIPPRLPGDACMHAAIGRRRGDGTAPLPR